MNENSKSVLLKLLVAGGVVVIGTAFIYGKFFYKNNTNNTNNDLEVEDD